MKKPSEKPDFSKLTFKDFGRLAQDHSLSKYEKIGFPDSYRAGKEHLIFADICHKLPALDGHERTILDIGPGCSDLPQMLIERCAQHGHTLFLIDNSEMLSSLPEGRFIRKIPGRFPDECYDHLLEWIGRFDAVLAYSVLHYVLPGYDIFAFIDRSLSLLASGGRLLVGDVPNVSMRKRFLASETGIKFYQGYSKTSDLPEIKFNEIEADRIDDGVIVGILTRARTAGFHSHVVPQDSRLPMANRREDLLFIRP